MCVLEYQIWTRHRIEILISREMIIIMLIAVDHHNYEIELMLISMLIRLDDVRPGRE